MINVKAPSLAHAHEQVVRKIFWDGIAMPTEGEESAVEVPEGTCIYVYNPLQEPMISPRSRFQKKFMDKYAKDLIEGSPAVFEYDYHDRLYDYKGSEDAKGINQIEYIIDKLGKEPYSRRAVAITWQPYNDEGKGDVPCLQLAQFAIRPVGRDPKNPNVVELKTVFRSNDMLTAAGANMYALGRMQERVAEELGMPVGPYTHISLLPHLYFIRDVSDLETFIVYPGGSTRDEYEQRLGELIVEGRTRKAGLERLRKS